MKVGVDVSWMVGNYRGMGRFARQLVDPIKPSTIGLAPRNIAIGDLPCISSGCSFFPWWEQVELPRLCSEQQLDYLLCPYNTGPLRSLGSTRCIAIIHDLIFMQPWSVLPPSISPYQTFGRLYRSHVVPALARRADTILTVSQFTKGELINRFGLPAENVHVIPNAISDSWFESPKPLSSRQPYLFTVAGEAASKNVGRLLEAFSLALPALGKEGRLKIAGIKAAFHPSFMRISKHLNIEDKVDFLGYLSEQELRRYYQEAKAFIFASLFEGFGIPLLEAMASGTPVACSDTTSMPEVIGECGLLFDPRSPSQMAERIVEVWHGNHAASVRSEMGLHRARHFSESVVSDAMRSFWRQLQ